MQIQTTKNEDHTSSIDNVSIGGKFLENPHIYEQVHNRSHFLIRSSSNTRVRRSLRFNRQNMGQGSQLRK